jgi:hypothetical protein
MLMRKTRNSITLLLLAVWLAACSALPALERHPERDVAKRNALYKALLTLGPINPDEAMQIANVGVYYTKQLAKEYKLVKPPSLHNSLVNMKMKPRGLCFHWENDIHDRLRSLNLRTVDIYWGVANPGVLFDEHSSVIITPRGQNFHDGILLDGWRDSGSLYWNYVKRDPKYRWIPFKRIQ